MQPPWRSVHHSIITIQQSLAESMQESEANCLGSSFTERLSYLYPWPGSIGQINTWTVSCQLTAYQGYRDLKHTVVDGTKRGNADILSFHADTAQSSSNNSPVGLEEPRCHIHSSASSPSSSYDTISRGQC